MKKAFRSILALVLVCMLMASAFCIPGIAASDTVYTLHLSGTSKASVTTEEVYLAEETTYTVSFYWKSVSGDAQVQLSGSAVGGNTKYLIVDGSYTMSGTNYDWQTGKVTYTFTTGTALEEALVFSALQPTENDSNFYIGGVTIYESDAAGVAVDDGEVVNLDFYDSDYQWTVSPSQYEENLEQKDTSFFPLESAPSGSSEKILIFKSGDNYDERSFNKQVSVTSGKTYTFTMYYKSISESNTGDIVVNNTGIITGGRYDTQDGAVYDGYTGLVKYTFTASSDSIYINMENRLGQGGKHKNYAIACPQLFESDAEGNAVSGGDVIDCDPSFDSWYCDGWNGHQALWGESSFVLGSADFFVTKFANQQPENGVYVMTYQEQWNQRTAHYTVDGLTAGAEYTFSMYFKNLGGNTAQFNVGTTTIINGGTFENGAVYDAKTGKVTYKFTASGTSVELNIESRGTDITNKNFKIADPCLTDASGTVIGCNIDFSQWITEGWGFVANNEFTVSVGQYSDFPTEIPVHKQPATEGKVYTGTFNEWFYDSWVGTSVTVESGKTYTFSILYKFGKGEDVTLSLSGNAIGDSKLVLAKNNAAVNADYDYYTGRYSYTFTAAGDTLGINVETGSVNNQYVYWIADPQLIDSENKSVNCDVDFCAWDTDGLYNRHNYFSIAEGDASFFGNALVTGDLNCDGSFNILDLVALKKYLASARTGLRFEALGTTSASVNADSLVTVKQWLLCGAEVLSNDDVLTALNTASTSGYALGVHTAGSTVVDSCVSDFSTAMDAEPGYIDYDMHSLPFVSDSDIDRAVTQLTRFAMSGGFVTLTAHWLNPETNIADATLAGAVNSRAGLTAEQYNNVMKAETSENTNFLSELAIEAAFIKKLSDNGVSVIFRPMHEGNQAYFWWGVNSESGITAEMYANLYRYVYNYFTVTCGLDNILWQFNVDRSGFDAATVKAMYPGDAYVDTISMDWYLGATSTANDLVTGYNALKDVADKPFAVAEFGGYGDYDIYGTSLSTTIANYIDAAVSSGVNISYVGPYLNWTDITK